MSYYEIEYNDKYKKCINISKINISMNQNRTIYKLHIILLIFCISLDRKHNI